MSVPQTPHSHADGSGGSLPDVTLLLESMQRGDSRAAEQLLPLVYTELRELAASYMNRERPGQTLDATGLVHEAFLRLVQPSDGSVSWNSRGHFFGAAAQAMRRILVERYRAKHAAKRGGDRQRVDFGAAADVATLRPGDDSDADGTDLVRLDVALDRLAGIDARKSEVVMLRYFAGLNNDQAAMALGVSEATVRREWTYAKAWLAREMRGLEG